MHENYTLKVQALQANTKTVVIFFETICFCQRKPKISSHQNIHKLVKYHYNGGWLYSTKHNQTK